MPSGLVHIPPAKEAALNDGDDRPESGPRTIRQEAEPTDFTRGQRARDAGLDTGLNVLDGPEEQKMNGLGKFSGVGERIGLFRVALGADEVPKAKPDADGLLLCCEKLGVKAEDGVYVGDSPSDGKAARAAGMKSIGVLWGANGEAALTDHFDVLCEDVPSLIKALRGMLTPDGK